MRLLATILIAVVVAGGLAYYLQLTEGLTVTGMGREVSWGLYISNFTFLVGVAASAVILVVPYYLYDYRRFGTLTLLGEVVAIAAVIMCILFVLVDLGRVDRVLNILRYPSPTSVMFYDLIVLSTYMLMNVGIVASVLRGKEKWGRAIAIASIPWAIGIHTVTAFIYSGLIARSFWNTAVLAPRFLASAFASGASVMILLSRAVERYGIKVGDDALFKLAEISAFAMLCNLFMIFAEIFTTMYSGNPEHVTHYLYIARGLGNFHTLTPLWWASMALGLASVSLLVIPRTRKNNITLMLASALLILSVWMEKGILLIVPAYIPSPTGDVVEYVPTVPEVLISAGIWAAGALFVILAIGRISKHRFEVL